MPQPRSRVGPEKPNPGSDGITTWKAGAPAAPCAAGSVSGPTSSAKSAKLLGQPCVSSSGVAGGYRLAGGTTLPPLLLDDDEAIAVALGLRTLAVGALDGVEETSVQALSKLQQLLPGRLRRRVDALTRATATPAPTGGGPTVSIETLTTLALACRDHERVRFEHAGRDGAPTPRHAEPHRLVALGRRWYLLAWDLDRADWRSFRIDRITGATATSARFVPRRLPAPDAVAYVEASVAATRTARYVVDVIVHAPLDVVAAEVAQWGTVEPVGDGRCRMRVQVDDLGWAAVFLGSLDADFAVIGPPELTAYLRRVGTRLASARTVSAPVGPAEPRC